MLGTTESAMTLVTAKHRNGDKFIVAQKDMDNDLVELRDRRGRLLGNLVSRHDIIAFYHGPVHQDAWPEQR